MKISKLEGKQGYKLFAKVGEQVYQENSWYRGTEASIEKLILISVHVLL